MLKNLNFKSKKGMSLAVALTICFFLILVTGGITTIALLQQTETGSNMNTRQAYISAKSGLDTMQNALQDNVVNGLPTGLNETGYYVLYYDKTNGNLVAHPCGNDENFAKSEAARLANEGHTIVGGEGTYFKVVYKGNNMSSVTALNTTGKFNNNISMNRGDLSFDMKKVDKYVFKVKEGSAPPPTPTSSNSRFMLVGQQTCLNEFSSDQFPTTTLRDYSVHSDGGNNNPLSGIFYIPSNENGSTHAHSAYTYFPVVYDKTVKVESDPWRVSINAIDEGFYLLGNSAGSLPGSFINENVGNVSYMTQNAAYRQYFGCAFFCIENNFITIRKGDNPRVGDYSMDPLIIYSGTKQNPAQGESYYVVAYVKGSVTFYVAKENRDKLESHTVNEGYYLIKTGADNRGAAITDPATWANPITDQATIDQWEEFNLYNTIRGFMDESGEIHSGTNEQNYSQAGSHNVEILDRNGKFKDGEGDHTGYWLNDTQPTYSKRDKHSVFMSPNYTIPRAGYYNWYCGRTLNFQWFRDSNTDFEVMDGAHIRMSASTIVLTIGPDVVNTNNPSVPVSVSKKVVGKGDATWKLYGTQGPNSADTDLPKLHVMSKFHVTAPANEDEIRNGVATIDYWIDEGTYTLTQAQQGLDLFSAKAQAYFTGTTYVEAEEEEEEEEEEENSAETNNAETGRVSTTATSASGVMPASVNAPTVRALSLFSRFNNRLALTPMTSGLLTIQDNSSHVYRFANTDPFTLNDQILVDSNIEKLLVNDGTDDGKHTIPVSTSLTIKMKKSDTESVDVVTIKSPYGNPIEIDALDGEAEFNIYDGQAIYDRMSDPNSNYELDGDVTSEIAIIEKYY